MEMVNVKMIAKLALAGLVSGVALSGCNMSAHHDDSSSSLVACNSVSKFGSNIPVMMERGDCEKIAGSQIHEITADDYVACFGVAAASKNDCATHSTSCGGSVAEARAPDAWITLPKGVCQQLQGATIGNLDTKKNLQGSGS